ncbi:MAG: hydantoinase B/oxoprolinase family protein [Hyphomicrobiales bacterium]|nr:hydantoinase B/oxoprolinase family protein [Hyphomicrobiales bacterium]
MTFDPIELQVINSRLTEITATMENQLFHSGYSPILRESFDGSAAILDKSGGVVAGTGAPIHLFPYSYVARSILRRWEGRMQPDDSFLINDPYTSGNFHVPDTAIVTPIFHSGNHVGFCASIAHKPDLGGIVPGSSGASAREIYHEGIRFPGMRYWSKQGPNEDVEELIRCNSRSPDDVIGDLRAQVGCTRIGSARLKELLDSYGVDVVEDAFEALIRVSERRIRDGLADWPDGEASAEAFLDNDGADLAHRIRMHIRIEKRGNEICFDYSGSDPNTVGPVNLRPQGAETAAAVALIGFLDPTIPINDGCRRAIRFVNPEGRITHAQYPRPVNNYYPSMHLLYCCAQKALAHFAPDKAVAPAGLGVGGSLIAYSKSRAGKLGVQYELMTPSLGGSPSGDGSFAVLPMMQITPSQPIEILESEYPVEVIRFQPLKDSAGPGRHRGGVGFVRAYRILEAANFSLRMGQFEHGSWGVVGGGAPNRACCILNPGTEREERLPPLATRQLEAGDVIWLELAGGGGYGNPLERPPGLVATDVREGLVSAEAAREIYGVILDPSSGTPDIAATTRLRDTAPKAKI